MTAEARGIGFAATGRPAAQERRARGTIVLAVAVAVLSIPVVVLAPIEVALPINLVQQLAVAALAVLALTRAARAVSGADRVVPAGLGIGIAMTGAGLVAWHLAPGHWTFGGGPDVLFGLGIAVATTALGVGITRDLRPVRATAVLEALIVIAATASVLRAAWSALAVEGRAPGNTDLAFAAAVLVVAVPAGAFLALLEHRVVPGLWGPFAVLQGMTVAGFGWLGWQAVVALGVAAPVSGLDYAYSAGIALIAWGGITWSQRPTAGPGYARFAGLATEAFPMAAVAVCLVLDLLLVEDVEGIDWVEIGAASVVGLTLFRQLLLVRGERSARQAAASASARLARAIEHRSAVLASIAALEAGDGVEDTARLVCDRATDLEGVDWAILMAWEPTGDWVVLAEAGPVPSLAAGDRRPPERAAYLAARASAGPWWEDLGASLDPHLVALHRAGVRRAASAPLLNGDRVVGVIRLGVGSDDADQASREQLTTAREFGVVAGALLGPGLDSRAQHDATVATIRAVIRDTTFAPVFQPIVELTGGGVVGYEALTRFHDGTRPDLRFAEAWRAGLGAELELATMRAAVAAAEGLSPAAYLSLNVSPDLARQGGLLFDVLAGQGRPVVLEVTEHAPVRSYAELRAALRRFDGRVRIAVDDAGAGFAGLQHILEIDPDMVKLDIALVRGVDRDPARRALIGSMVAFSTVTGATLIAEGVETESEAETLRQLGVTRGQGFLFGRPGDVPGTV